MMRRKHRFQIVFWVIALLILTIPSWAAEDGTQKWALETGDDVTSSPAIGSDGTIYVGSYDGNLYAINEYGIQQWAFETGGIVLSSPAIGSDGTIYLGSSYYLYAINPNGSQNWAYEFVYETIENVYTSPVIGADGTIYVGAGYYLYAINPDGTQEWVYSTSYNIGSSPAIGADGTIYVVSGYYLYAINPDGTEKKTYYTYSLNEESPLAIGADGTIYLTSGNYLYAIDPDMSWSSNDWRYETGGTGESGPAIGADGTIYVGTGGWDNKLYAINSDGTKKWVFNTRSNIYSTPAIGSDGTIYVGSGANLHAINSDGTEKWAFETGGAVDSSPAIGSDGTIYVGSRDNSFFAVNGSSGGLANTPWPMFHHDLLHTGRASATSPIYRFFSTQTNAHFFTIDEEEKDTIIANYPWYRYEGIAWYAYAVGNEPDDTSPIYRFFSTQTNAHFFTIDEEEKDTIIANYPWYRYEGIAWYAYAVGNEPDDTSPIYRFFSTQTNAHFFTIDEEEKDTIIANYPWYRYEGIAWYAYAE